jgi:hypothetical protein
MQTRIAPETALVTHGDAARLRRDGVTGWLMTNHHNLLEPTFHFDEVASRAIVARCLESDISHQIGSALVGPRELRIADRLAIAEFSFRDTKRRIPIPSIAAWLAAPPGIDWTMQLYYAGWHAYLTAQSLAGWLAWQEQGLLPATALRRMRQRLLEDAVGLLTRLELIEFLKHLDKLAAEW